MPHLHNHRTAATRHQPPMDAADLDAFLIDDEFDDYLDRHVSRSANRWPTSATSRRNGRRSNMKILVCGGRDYANASAPE